MYRKVRTFLTVVMLVLLTTLSSSLVFSAEPAGREDFPTIAGIAAADERFETLVSAVQQAGLADALAGPGPMTVFAPTDAAFAKLPAGTLESLTADQLQSILRYHVVSGDVSSEIAKTLSSATTLNGEPVQVKVFEGDIYLNDDSKVIIPDIVASNGRIHVIDTVLLPPSIAGTGGDASAASDSEAAGEAFTRPELPTLVDIAAGNASFSTLVSAVQQAGLAETLSGPGPFTVFAPTNAAFAKLPAGTLDALSAEQLRQILLYHVVSGDVGSEIAKTLSSAATMQGEPVQIKVFEDDLYLNDDAKVVLPDVVAANGVIHVIDTVILPPSMQPAEEAEMQPVSESGPDPTGMTIAEVAAADGRFDTLVAAAQQAGLVSALSGEGPLTVFAPTDAAFAALPEGTLDSLSTDQLRNILLYHVVSGDVGSEIAKTLNSATTLNGRSIDVKVFEGDLYINDDAKVVIQDIVTSNGRIHVIDTVLLPPAGE